YNEGDRHGLADRQAHLIFDFAHDSAYQQGYSDFQSGYEQGYTDGFNGYNSQFGNGSGHDQDQNYNENAVTIFTQPGFTGAVQNLTIGQYRHIDLRDVESIQFNRNVRVTVFTEPNFHGRAFLLTHDSGDLRFLQNRSFWSFGLLRRTDGSIIIEQPYR